VPEGRYYYVEPPHELLFGDDDLKALARPLRKSGIAGLSFGYVGTRVTDRGLFLLGEQPQLRYLDLSNIKLTETGLLALANFPNLEFRPDRVATGILN
jgi:hypothetical protein